ncbi:unnamed protein product [Pleuronectes platessa]|uniref:Uncharacterized protein n=1 Tax=Pleuronectes platessa TaxID=8262 RepID=A0A9N7V5W7_PLEPL|nr:unnamed protein product [Pleuronectes platessa]
MRRAKPLSTLHNKYEAIAGSRLVWVSTEPRDKVKQRACLRPKMRFFLDPHQSVDLSATCSTVAMGRNEPWRGREEAGRWNERKLKGLAG